MLLVANEKRTGTPNMTATPAIAILLDEREIERVMLRYLRGVDRCDGDLIRAAFHDDAVDHHGSFTGGPNDYVEYVLKRAMPQFERTMHYVTNMLIDVDGDLAHVETYVLAVHLRNLEPAPQTSEVFGGRYFDRFERRDDRWRIAERWVLHEWDSAHTVATNPAWQQRFIQGLRGHADVSFSHRQTPAGQVAE